MPNFPAPTFDYDRNYYESFRPEPYRTNSPVWNDHFGRAADQVIEVLKPASVIEAGCAMGVLVRQFLKRGVPVAGFDYSEDAIKFSGAADENLVGHIFQHDLRAPLDRVADVVICIEVLEHIEAEGAAPAVKTLCDMADRYVVFSSTPDDVDSIQHPNVQQPDYWDALFRENGFRPTDLNAKNFCPWCIVYERFEDRKPELVEDIMDEPDYEDEGATPFSLADTKDFPSLQNIADGGDYVPEVVAEDVVKKPKGKKRA